jgi:hypothetical protein
MAKPLRDIASKAPKEGKLSGVKKSTTEPEDISDFNASSGNQDFAKDHKVEKHSDRVGNDDDVYKGKTKKAEMQRHGYKKPQDEKIYEAKCNMTEAGTMCEVHGDKACSSDKVPEAGVGKRGMIADKKKLQEVLTKKTGAYYGMHKENSEQLDEMPSQHRSAAGSGRNTNPNLSKLARKLSMEKPRYFRPKDKKSKADERDEGEKLSAGKEIKRYPAGKAKGVREEAEQIDEISKDLAGDYIKSASSSAANLKTDAAYANMTNDDARANKNRDKARNRQAGIYTAVNKITGRAKVPANEELAMPMLEGGKKKKTEKESAPGDTPIRMPSGNVGDSDTGRI